MKELKDIRDRQNQLTQEARGYLDQITDDTNEGEARELEQKFDQHMAEVDSLEERAVRLEKLGEAEKRQKSFDSGVDETRRPGSADEIRSEGKGEVDEQPGPKMTEERAFELAVRFGAGALGNEARSLLRRADERDLPEEIRAQSVGTDSAGGYTVPEGFQAEIVKSMAMWGPMLDPGVTRVLNTATGNPIPWPTVDDTSNVGALLAENTQEGEQDVTFGQKMLDAYKYSSDIVRVSLELLQDSAFDMDQLLAELFGERLGRISNTALTTGTGSSQPNGIMTASTTGVTAAAVSAITFDEVIELLHSVDPAYRASPRCAFMFNDSTLEALRKLKDGQGNYLWQAADGRSGEPASILGYPYVINQAVASLATGNRTMAFGDMNKYVVRRVREFTLLRLSERYADFYQVGYLAFNRVDGELMDAAAVKHLVQA